MTESLSMKPGFETYQLSVINYIENALERPSMFFHQLKDLEQQLDGHSVAYEELGYITRKEGFNSHFRSWLYQNERLSCSSGWAYRICTMDEAVLELAKKNAIESEPVKIFEFLVRKFLEEWQHS
ncbi:MAG: hypothetical protein R3C11_14300 [Planctomycetaceae bacterium]